MKKDVFDFVSTPDLRIGLFVDLEVGWMTHPFASSRFKISSPDQIAALRGLGVSRIRYIPAKSDPLQSHGRPALPADADATVASACGPGGQMPAPPAAQAQARALAELRAAQLHGLAVCELRFGEAAQQYHTIRELMYSKPAEAARFCLALVQGLTAQVLQHADASIRLLSDGAGDKVALHPVNTMVLSLLLGQALGMQAPDLQNLALAALLHDVGKLELTERLRHPERHFTQAEHHAYQSHVAISLRLAQGMGLNPGTLQAIEQHHELADGSGFPQRLRLDAIGMGARILALANRYDGLCNPATLAATMTPHEALAMIFSQQKACFDSHVLSSFVRMVGVYPPGSVVQLNDERQALVVSVNAARPLKPRVIVHTPGLPRHEALVVDLEQWPMASIRRSLKPANLSPEAQDFLRPRTRMRYFFETTTHATRQTAFVWVGPFGLARAKPVKRCLRMPPDRHPEPGFRWARSAPTLGSSNAR
jgi:HD-GYP domain-containing protein (c-di-GMP phosphodiesterase class II)